MAWRRQIDLFAAVLVAIEGRKFKAVSTCDKNFTAHALKKRLDAG